MNRQDHDTEFTQNTMSYMADGWHLPIWKCERRTAHYGWASHTARHLLHRAQRRGRNALRQIERWLAN